LGRITLASGKGNVLHVAVMYLEFKDSNVWHQEKEWLYQGLILVGPLCAKIFSFICGVAECGVSGH
jgi:hypothetical protein